MIGGLLAAHLANAEQPPASVADALIGGKANVSFRLRYEGVDDASLPLTATAATLRSRLTWQSSPYDGLRALVEVDDVRAPIEEYNSTGNGRTTRPIVADPPGTDLNRAAIEWQSGTTRVAVGRQRINLDNQRFIGGAGWRQNEQTFDGVTARSELTTRLELVYGYLYQVNRVYGPDNGTQAAEWHGRIHLFQARLDTAPAGKLTAFGYATDFHNAPAQSASTMGLLWNLAPSLGAGWTLPMAFSYARQTDYGNAPTRYSAHYVQAELGIARDAWTAKVGREVLSGDRVLPAHRFQTPLATLHIFQGWADKFLVTPPKGIEDSYISVSGKLRAVTLQVAWHDYRADAARVRYGSEWDALASVPFGSHYEALLKLADYRADALSTDTRKIWLMVSAQF